jgi:hypothetical protein
MCVCGVSVCSCMYACTGTCMHACKHRTAPAPFVLTWIFKGGSKDPANPTSYRPIMELEVFHAFSFDANMRRHNLPSRYNPPSLGSGSPAAQMGPRPARDIAQHDVDRCVCSVERYVYVQQSKHKCVCISLLCLLYLCHMFVRSTMSTGAIYISHVSYTSTHESGLLYIYIQSVARGIELDKEPVFFMVQILVP